MAFKEIALAFCLAGIFVSVSGIPWTDGVYGLPKSKECPKGEYKEVVTKEFGYGKVCKGEAVRNRCGGACTRDYYADYEYRIRSAYNPGGYRFYPKNNRHGHFGYHYGPFYRKNNYPTTGSSWYKHQRFDLCCAPSHFVIKKQDVKFDCGKDGYKEAEVKTKEPGACFCHYCAKTFY